MEDNFIENEQYSFEHVIVDAETDIIHESFGISDERSKELRFQIVERLKQKVVSNEFELLDVRNLAKVLKCISDMKVNTLGEFAFTICIVEKAAQTVNMLRLG